MAAFTVTLTYTSSYPRDNRTLSRQSITINNSEPIRLTATVADNYRRVILKGLQLESGNPAATLPGVADGERCTVFFIRAGQALSHRISSKTTVLSNHLNSGAYDSFVWDWDALDLSALSVLQPGDTLEITVPAIDDGGAPTADLVIGALFEILEN